MVSGTRRARPGRPKVPKRNPTTLTELEVAWIKAMLSMGVPQTKIADVMNTYQKAISDINTGQTFQHVVGLEVWSRDVTGGLHKRIVADDLKEAMGDDPYALYVNEPSKGEK